MPFLISADFLLGAYQGRDSGGEPERYPTPDRLYKALVSAACLNLGFRSSACQDNKLIESSLQWLEGNPPDAIYLPKAIMNDGGRAVSYRDKGHAEGNEKRGYHEGKKVGSPALNVAEYPDTGSPLTWQWQNEPPSDVAACIASICEEVPYLGESQSPVHLGARTCPDDEYPVEGSFALDKEAGIGSLNTHLFFDYPATGRLQELCDAYDIMTREGEKARKAEQKKRKIASKEDEQNLLAQLPAGKAVVRGAYHGTALVKATDRITPPWDRMVLLPVCSLDRKNWQPDESQLVSWAVALHRILVKAWGAGASPMLTGKYAKGVPHPANNVAIQILSGHLGDSVSQLDEWIRSSLPAFLVLVPCDMPDEDFGRLCEVCQALVGRRLYYSRSSETLRIKDAIPRDDAKIWSAPEEGGQRYWRVVPFSMAETRAFVDIDGKRKWRAYETVALSIGHVWRSYFSPAKMFVKMPSRAKERVYWEIADAVMNAQSPVHICKAYPQFRVHMEDYAHHVQQSNILRGAGALLRFDPTMSDVECTAMVIGQTRHLGGGLLVPDDDTSGGSTSADGEIGEKESA